MTTSAGDLQVGFGEESSWNTPVTPDHFIEVTDESVKQTIDRIESSGLRTNRVLASSANWTPGNVDINGDLNFEFQSRGMGLLLKHLTGVTPTITTPGGGSTSRNQATKLSATETTDGKGLTFQIARTDVAGARQKFTYSGAKIASWELSCNAGEILMGKVTLDAASETQATGSVTSPTYPTGTPLVYAGAAITLAGSSFDVKSFDIKGDNGLKTDRYVLGSTTKKEQLQTGLRSVTGTLGVEWTGLTAYQRFTTGATATLQAKFQSLNTIDGSIYASLTITMEKVRFDGDTPVGGGQLIEHNLNFVALDDESTGTSPVLFDYTSLDTSA